MDDLIVTKTDQGYLYVVSNAGCADKDLAHMKVNPDGSVRGEVGGRRRLRDLKSVFCVIFRPNWQSSKLQVLTLTWSSLMQRWLLCKVTCLPRCSFSFLLFCFMSWSSIFTFSFPPHFVSRSHELFCFPFMPVIILLNKCSRAFHSFLCHVFSLLKPFLNRLIAWVDVDLWSLVCRQVPPWLRCCRGGWRRTSASWPSWRPPWPPCSAFLTAGSPAAVTPERMGWRLASHSFCFASQKQLLPWGPTKVVISIYLSGFFLAKPVLWKLVFKSAQPPVFPFCCQHQWIVSKTFF